MRQKTQAKTKPHCCVTPLFGKKKPLTSTSVKLHVFITFHYCKQNVHFIWKSH